MRSSICALAIAIGIAYGVNKARADAPALTMTSYTFRPANSARFSIGYTFTLDQPIVITALGALDFGGTTIAAKGPMPVALYYSSSTNPNVGQTFDGVNFSSAPVVGASVMVTASDPIMAPDGSPYVSGDGFRYHVLPNPIALYATGYEIQSNNENAGYATNWVGLTTFDGITAPIKSTYSMDQPTTADYEINTLTGAENFGQAFVGPNFLIQTPEPTVMALVAMASVALIRRR
jgi:hypothetical protein